MNRLTVTKLHLALGALFFPFLLIMPISGGLHVLGIDGEIQKTPAFTIEGFAPENKQAQEAFFREQFKANGVDYDFGYIRASGKDFTFRPTTKTFYTAMATETGYQVSLNQPDFLRRLFEMHKGHGPLWAKTLEAAFAVALLVVTFSGCWLAYSSPVYRRTLLVSFAIGAAMIFAAFF